MGLIVGGCAGLAVVPSWSSSGRKKGLLQSSSEWPSFSVTFLLLSATDTFRSGVFAHRH